VYSAGVLDRLASCGGAAEAMHADLKEELRGLDIGVENFADNGLLRYSHLKKPSLLRFCTFIISLFPRFVKGGAKKALHAPLSAFLALPAAFFEKMAKRGIKSAKSANFVFRFFRNYPRFSLYKNCILWYTVPDELTVSGKEIP
jgi:hypothetical protein